MKKAFIISFSVIFLFACKDKNEDYRKLYKSTINLPYNLPILINDSIITGGGASIDDKIVLYIDSTDCYRCDLKLNEWKRFMAIVNGISNNKVNLLVYIHFRSINEAKYYSHRNKSSIPIYLDLNNEFKRLNAICGRRINCFYVNDQNKIQLVGNPIYHKEIKKLYLKYLCEKFNSNYEDYLKELDKLYNSMGVFNWQVEQQTSFVVNNDNDEPMYIDSLYTSCECTTATIDRREIAPHKKAVVNVTFKADRPEQFMREIYADVRGGEQIVMVIEGEAIEL